jgi:hypothetical protein
MQKKRSKAVQDAYDAIAMVSCVRCEVIFPLLDKFEAEVRKAALKVVVADFHADLAARRARDARRLDEVFSRC